MLRIGDEGDDDDCHDDDCHDDAGDDDAVDHFDVGGDNFYENEKGHKSLL